MLIIELIFTLKDWSHSRKINENYGKHNWCTCDAVEKQCIK